MADRRRLGLHGVRGGGGGNPAVFEVSGRTHPDTGESCWQSVGDR